MENKNYILHFMCYAAPYSGNFMKSIFALEEEAKIKNIDIIYLFEKDVRKFSWVQDMIAEGKIVFFLDKKFIDGLNIIRSILSKYNVKIVHTHFTGVKYHTMFNILRKFLGYDYAIISHLHNHYKGVNNFNLYLKNTMTGIDLYLGCSESVTQHHIKVNKLSSDKVICVTNAVDFSRLGSYQVLSKATLGFNPTTKVFLIFGFDYYRKGVDIALIAFEKAIRNGLNVGLLLSLSTNKDKVLEKIKNKFNSVPSWLKIVDARDDIATFYKSSNAFISSSRSEGFCYALVEAAYCGIATIASDIPGQNSLNIPYTLQFENENHEELFEKIFAIASMSEEELILKQQTQISYVKAKFDLNVWVNKVFSCYHKFL